MTKLTLQQLTPYRWQLPVGSIDGMRVPGEIFATEDMLSNIVSDNALKQVANVATLPGIVRASLAMPDIHWGYGFPIGGVAAFNLDDGVVSPGGVGYDINCGVSLIRSDLVADEVKHFIPKMVDALFNSIPCGVGSQGSINLNDKDLNNIFEKGAEWVVDYGLAESDDMIKIEENGTMSGGDPSLISPRARERAQRQLGTLGSGNHFIEIQEVTDIYESEVAEAFGLFKGQLVVMLHSGSRGLGHQVCQDQLKTMQHAVRRYGIDLPDRQLACAPIKSPEGQAYLSAMKCAANFAWSNRLAMVGLIRRAFTSQFKKSWYSLGMRVVWDVAHNIAKIESFNIDGKQKELCVHRKGATRALGPDHPLVPEDYRKFGQPVIIPGDMGRASFVLVGAADASNLTFGSSCHGAGRVLSRRAAVKASEGQNLTKKMAKLGVIVRAKGKTTLSEEMPEAYKDIYQVVEAVQGVGISRKVARMRPLGTVKG